MTTTAKPDYTHLLLLQRHGTPTQRQAASLILDTLTNTPVHLQKAALQTLVSDTPKGFPLPHGASYDSLAELVKDVQARCTVEKCTRQATNNFTAQVIAQYTADGGQSNLKGITS